MTRFVLCLAGCCMLVLTGVGCLTTTQVAAYQPHNYVISPTLDTKTTWRVAALPPTTSASAGEAPPAGLYDYAGMVLMRTGRFTVVDRATVDILLREQEFSYTGVVDVGTAAQLGRMLGAEAVMTVNVTRVVHDNFWSDEPAQRVVTLHVKVVSVETSEVLYSAVGEGSDFEGAEGALRMALETALYGLKRN